MPDDDSLQSFMDEMRERFKDSPDDMAELEDLAVQARQIVEVVYTEIARRSSNIRSQSPYISNFLQDMVTRILNAEAP